LDKSTLANKLISLLEAVNSESFLINHLRLPSEIGRATNEVGFHWVSWWYRAK
jgi:hypothetical protein